MSKVKKYSRHILVLLIALVTAVSCMLIFAPQADAANTEYTYKIVFNTTNSVGSTKGAYVKVYFKANNGTGGETSTTLTTSDSYWTSESSHDLSSICTTPGAGYFPYKIETYVSLSITRKSEYNIDLYIYNNNTGAYEMVYDGGNHKLDTTWGADDATFTDTLSDYTKFPYVANASVSGYSTPVFGEEDLSLTQSWTVTGVDQYGVEWVNNPTLAASGYTLSSTSTKSPTATFNNAAADYGVSLTGTWTSANTSHASETKTLFSDTARVTRSLTFDNLFDYNAFRNAGITSGAGTVSSVTSKGFTITCPSDPVEAVTNWSAMIPVTAGTEYGISADITASSGAVKEIYVQWLDSSGGHLAYKNVREADSGSFGVAPANAAYARIRFDCDVPAGSTGSVKFENIRFFAYDGQQETISVPTPTISVAYNKAFADYTASVPTRNAYTFDGWYIDLGAEYLCFDASGKWVLAGSETLGISGYMTDFYTTPLYSKWTPVTYTVNFNSDGGSSVDSVSYNIESTSLNLPTPTRTGYTFTGWTVSNAAGNWTNGETVTSTISGKYGNITVTANWTPNKYTVLFDTIMDFDSAWILGNASRGTAELVGDNGIKLTNTDASSESTLQSDFIPVTAGKEYYVNMDISGEGAWDVYVFFMSSDSTEWIGFTDSTSRFSSNGSGNQARTFTAPEGAARMQIRIDSNEPGKAVTFEDIRVIEVGTAVTDAIVPDSVKEVTYDSTYGELPVPTRNGYDFTGWFTSDGSQILASDTVKITSDLNVYSKWTPHVHTFTIDENGGDTVSDATYTIEEGALPAAPSRTGYTFSHWEIVADAGNWSAGDTYVPGDSTVGMYGDVAIKAIWTANDYTITYDLNEGDLVTGEASCTETQKTVTFDSATGTLPVPAHTCYEFTGWTTEDGTAVTADTVWKIAEDTVLYANWTPTKYTVSFDSNNGSAISETVTYDVDDTAITLPTTSRDGYTFVNYTVSVVGGNWAEGDALNDSTVYGHYGDITVKANWSPLNYTVTLDLNDTTGVGSATCDSESIQVEFDASVEKLETLPAPARDGYTFIGWFTEAEGGEQVTAATVYTTVGNSTYYAHWEAIEYTLSFNVNNGDAIDPITYTIETDLTLPVAVRTGYDFNFWINTGALSGTWAKNESFYSDALALGTGNWGDVTLRANYNIHYFNITWVVGEDSTTTTAAYNTVPKYGANPTLDDIYYDYTFTGWTPAVVVATEDTTYTAQFTKTAKIYTVTWVDENGDTVDSREVAYGADIPTDVEVPEKEGYTGTWDYSGNTTMPAADLTVTPDYEAIVYTATWVVDGTTVYTTDVAYGALPTYTGATPERAETDEYTYTFKGWSPSVSEVLKGNTTYTAEFNAIPKEYTIKWMGGESGNVLVKEQIVAFGTAISSTPTVPEVVGKVGSWKDVPETMPAKNITIYAEYVEGSVITWYTDGTATGAYYQKAFATGAAVAFDRDDPSIPATAEYTYTFAGWATTEGGEVVYTDHTSFPASTDTDVAYYAVYTATANSYTIKWVADGTTVLETTLKYGDNVENVPAVPEKTGYTGEWDSTYATMPAADTVINAVYTPIDYTITWVIDGVSYKTTWAYGTKPSCTESTDKASSATTDYTFIGWTPAIETVSGDATYTANYSESVRKYTVTWEYEDGSTIDTEDVENGATITYIPTFKDVEGHDPVYTIPNNGVMPTENITIVVKYEAKSYTITWVTPDGNVETTWKYGETPAWEGDAPEKAPTAEKEYAFSKWSPAISTVTGNATYTALFTESARKYTIVWYVDNKFYKTEDVAFGAGIPAVSVPEKEGYNGSWDNIYVTMPAMDLSINSVYTARKYTVYWKVDGLTVYSASVAYGDAIPAQTVPAKEGQTGVWTNVPEKMPAENITIVAEYTANTYSVSWRVDGVTTTDTATYGKNYTINFKDTIPEDVKVTIGGQTVITGYTYDAEKGILVIEGNAITGDISVLARAAGGLYILSTTVYNGTSSNEADSIGERTAYFTQFSANAGYLLPERVYVYVDGELLIGGYTYDSDTGKLTINAESVIGEIEIVAECLADPDYDPNASEETHDCDCNCHSDSAFIQFFFKLFTFLRKIFGLTQYRYCECGNAHW